VFIRAAKKILGNQIGRLACFIDPKIMAKYIYALIYRLSINRPAKESLIFLLELERHLYNLTGTESCRYGDGIHSKHRHLGYHEFFIKNISSGEKVLDIGCGNGALTYHLAKSGALVTAMDRDATQIRFAKEHFDHPNIQWIYGEAPQEIPQNNYQFIVLSNVLEHVEDRIDFIKRIMEKTDPKIWLIRVPCYDRDWRVPLMDELGVDFLLDNTHYIEYTRDVFEEELNQSDLIPSFIEVRWGEIWCRAKCKKKRKLNGSLSD
jgi:SAM-dependent methyltransferase